MRFSCLLFLATFMCAICFAQTMSIDDLAEMEGEWEGALTYRDFQSNERTEIPATLHVRGSELGTALFLEFVFTDPGYKVEDVQVLTQTRSRSGLIETLFENGRPSEREWRIEDSSAVDDGLKLVIATPSTDDNRPAIIRRTIDLQGDSLKILQEISYGDRFEFRNEITLKRKTD